MNLLLFEPNEIDARGLLTVNGERARHLVKVKKVAPGEQLRVGELNGKMGTAVVREAGADTVTLTLIELGVVPSAPTVDLILALPRPQTLKKVLETVAAMGVGQVMLISSQKVEKSYFSAKVLHAEQLLHYLRLGLSQGMFTILPQVSIHPRFRDFIEGFLPTTLPGALPGTLRLVATPQAEQTMDQLFRQDVFVGANHAQIAVGPEGGWNEFEIGRFVTKGFLPVSIGPRVLRVEQAVCAILSQVELLRKLTRA